MKKIFVTAAALALTSPALQARDLEQGSIMVTGDTNLSISSTDFDSAYGETSTDTTELNLVGAYFLAKNIGVGLMLSREDSDTEYEGGSYEETTTLLGPVVGYNISLNNQTSVMIEGSVFMLEGDQDSGGSSSELDGEGFMLGGSVHYFLNDNVSVNAGLRMIEADVEVSQSGGSYDADMSETSMTIGLSTFF